MSDEKMTWKSLAGRLHVALDAAISPSLLLVDEKRRHIDGIQQQICSNVVRTLTMKDVLDLLTDDDGLWWGRASYPHKWHWSKGDDGGVTPTTGERVATPSGLKHRSVDQRLFDDLLSVVAERLDGLAKTHLDERATDAPKDGIRTELLGELDSLQRKEEEA